MFVYEKIRMMKNKPLPKPTDSELEILQILWDEGPSTVREVHDKLSAKKSSGYTTTLKFMQIMHDKGLVKRNTEARSHVYSAVVSRETTRSQMVDKLITTLFQGSSSSLVMEALGHHRATGDELRAIRAYLERLDGETAPGKDGVRDKD
jgi:predicted transcriptional regulator